MIELVMMVKDKPNYKLHIFHPSRFTMFYIISAVIVNASNVVLTKAYGDVTLKCNVDNPSDILRWSKDNIKINNTVGKFVIDDVNNTLTVQVVGKSINDVTTTFINYESISDVTQNVTCQLCYKILITYSMSAQFYKV